MSDCPDFERRIEAGCADAASYNMGKEAGRNEALREVKDALRGLPRADSEANYFVDHIVEGFFGKGGRFEIEEAGDE